MKLIAYSITTLCLLSYTVPVWGSFPFGITQRLRSRQPAAGKASNGGILERMTVEAFFCVCVYDAF